jgi:hypothetical protein
MTAPAPVPPPENGPGQWDCDAYGPEGTLAGALCFFAGGLGTRVCTSPEECREKMATERQRLWQRIQDRAARGDPDMVHLAAEFTGPEQLLGGEQADEDASGG